MQWVCEHQPRPMANKVSWLCGVQFLLCMEAVLSGTLQPAQAPIVPGKPFLVLWGIPDSLCPDRVDPANFGLERGDQVALFYDDSLGLYPYYSPQNQAVSGGLPQHTSLDLHLQSLEADLITMLPSQDFSGLGVLYWDDWAPQWQRNRAKQEIYQEESRALLRNFFPDWVPVEVDNWAQVDFESAAQAVLTETLRAVKKLRPHTFWGFSPYPDCHNSGPAQQQANYTGRCPAAEMALNDELLWLWEACSALYPVLQLDQTAGGTSAARLYATNQIREALRVAGLTGATYDLPVFPLVRSVYTSTNFFLSEEDLVHTIGESAAMGAAGVIIWEKFFPTKSQRGCWELATFTQDILGPYVVNVTTAARLCSVALCRGRGRCVRRDPESSAYLHLSSSGFLLLPEQGEGIRVEGEAGPDELAMWGRDFQCQWYQGGGLQNAPVNSGKISGVTGWMGTGLTTDTTETKRRPQLGAGRNGSVTRPPLNRSPPSASPLLTVLLSSIHLLLFLTCPSTDGSI